DRQRALNANFQLALFQFFTLPSTKQRSTPAQERRCQGAIEEAGGRRHKKMGGAGPLPATPIGPNRTELTPRSDQGLIYSITECSNCITNGSITISLILIWIAALFWSMAPLLGWGSYRDRMYGTCEIDWTKASFSTIYKSYIVSIFICCFFLPVLVMVLLSG
ncbi:unnamed protein product, partial [Ranitomeya imitator]